MFPWKSRSEFQNAIDELRRNVSFVFEILTIKTPNRLSMKKVEVKLNAVADG